MRITSRAPLRAVTGAVASSLMFLTMSAAAGTPPSPADVKRQQQEAARLQSAAQDQSARLQSVQAAEVALAARANQALDEYQQARELVAAAEASLSQREDQLAAAADAVAAARTRLNEFTARAYQNGVSGEALAAARLLLAETDPADLERQLTYLGSMGDWSVDILELTRDAAAAERRATEAARAAAAARRAAESSAAAAKRRADALVAEQQALVARAATQLSQTRSEAADAERRAAALVRERALALAEAARIAVERQEEALAAERSAARQRAAAAARPSAHQPPPIAVAPFRVVVSSGRCAGGDLGGYANGQLPTAALCPLWGAPGHLLRGDAAASFSTMSKAFAAEFSTPICVTDSYRPYSVQVLLYETKRSLAAYPGTSQHGWGRAADLCGGIQSFGTPEHEWLALNAPRFGWFHPSWAAPGGSRPEPWHFEYGG